MSQDKKSKTKGTEAEQEAQKPLSDKVDLNDLEWEDRERVLRLLFSKMNTGVNTSGQMKAKLRQAQNREAQIKALSDEGLKMIEQEQLMKQEVQMEEDMDK